MMKAVCIAIDAKYAHTNPAVRSIAAFARMQKAPEPLIAEFTINQRADDILAALYELDCGVYLFSCYIWNIEPVRAVAAELRKVRPDARIWAGGPEVSWSAEAFLRANPAFDLVIRGEGEETVARLLSGEEECPGVTMRRGDELIETPDAPPPDMDSLPFAYSDDLDALGDRAIYYESMRGCPFGCSYCLSSIQRGVRYRALKFVYDDLRLLLDARVRRVKFVDRTFNCDRDRALAIWRFLARHDNGVTNFHFELSGELLDEELLAFLAAVRPGLFQFEIGVQSANPQTLREVGRPCDLVCLFDTVRRLSQPGNIHLHLDLIAGLPFEDSASFERSFSVVYALRPAQLQVGFLKVLHGSGLERNAARYALRYRDCAPYQVLSTKWLSYGELLRLEGVAHMVDTYYNSGRFTFLVAFLERQFPSTFAFYEALAALWRQRGYDRAPPDKVGYYALLGEFAALHGLPEAEYAQWLCKYDMLLHERPRRLPAWVQVDLSMPHRRRLQAYARVQQGLQYVERFPFDPVTGEQVPVFLCFHYDERDLLGHAAVSVIPDAALGLS